MKRVARELYSAANLLLPPRNILPDEWVEKNRILPSSCNEPGLFRIDRCPWVREILRRAVDKRHNRLILCCGSQLSKTDGIFINLMGYFLSIRPRPVQYYAPTMDQARSTVIFRVLPMIESTPSLSNGVSRIKNSSIFEHVINGQRLGIGWMGSRTQARGHSAPIVMVDERDAVAAVGPEGDIVDVTWARSASYPDRKMIVASSPLKGEVHAVMDNETGLEHWAVDHSSEIDSPTWRLWQQGTRHEWAWPCPHCHEYFIPRRSLLRWGSTNDPSVARKNARMVCRVCGSEIDYQECQSMNNKGVFVAPGQKITTDGIVIGKEPENIVFSAWVSGLCSRWVKWGDRAYDLVKAANDEVIIPGSLQGVINTGTGELYSSDTESLDEHEARSCIGDYFIGEVNEEIIYLTMGIDVGDDRFIYVVRGWSKNMSSWLIDTGSIWGDTENPLTKNQLRDYIYTPIDGKNIIRVGMDAGYKPDNTYEFTRQHKGLVYPLKGTSTQKKIFQMSPVDVDINGKVIKGGAKLGTYNSNQAKSWVYSHMKLDHSENGSFLVPKDVDDGYFVEITAEYPVKTKRGEIAYRAKTRNNHRLDCECMAYIMSYSIGVASNFKKRVKKPESNKQTNSYQPGADWWGPNRGGFSLR